MYLYTIYTGSTVHVLVEAAGFNILIILYCIIVCIKFSNLKL